MRNHLLLSAVAVVILPLLAAPATVVANPLYPGYVLSTDPVLYWNFEEIFSNYTASDTAADAASLGGWNDGIGAKNSTAPYPAAGGQGVLGNAAVFTKGTTGSLGHAIEYTGLNSVASISPDSYSVQMWVKSTLELKTTGANAEKLHYFYARTQDSNPTMNYLSNTWQRPDTLGFNGMSGAPPRLAYYSYDGGSASAATDDADGQDGRPMTTPTPIVKDRWHHVVFVRESSGYVSAYLDGKLEIHKLDPLDPSYSQYIGSTLTIGSRPDYASNATLSLTGLMDEVAVWNRPLSASEANSLYLNSFSPYPYVASVLADSPAAYWRLEETTGTNVAYDSTGNGNSFNYKVHSDVSRTGTGNDIGPRPYEFLGMPADNLAATLVGGGSYLGDISGLLSNHNDYTAEMWFRPGIDQDAHGDYLLHRGPNTPYITGDFWGVGSGGIGSEYTNLFFMARYDGDGESVSGETPLTTGEWYHVAMVREGNEVSLYLDGRLEFSETIVPRSTFATGEWAFGGRLDMPWQQRFSGNIDEIAIYGRALSHDEIRSHYLAGVPEPSAWLLLALGGLSLAACRGRKKRRI